MFRVTPLLLLLTVIHASSALNFVFQYAVVTGAPVQDGTFTCETLNAVSLETKEKNNPISAGCSFDNKTKQLTVFSQNSPFHVDGFDEEIILHILTSKGDAVAFTIKGMKPTTDNTQHVTASGKYSPIATTPVPPSTTLPPTTTPCPAGTVWDTITKKCETPATAKNLASAEDVQNDAQGVLVKVNEQSNEADHALVRKIPLGPGPVIPHHTLPLPTEDDETVEMDSAAEPRKRRNAEDNVSNKDAEKTTPAQAEVYAVYLDEAGNPAAVWAAVIEGLILLGILGCFCYAFVIVPRRRRLEDAFKTQRDPNYSVSYDNAVYATRTENNNPNPGMTQFPQPTAQQQQTTNPGYPPQQRYDGGGMVNINLS